MLASIHHTVILQRKIYFWPKNQPNYRRRYTFISLHTRSKRRRRTKKCFSFFSIYSICMCNNYRYGTPTRCKVYVIPHGMIILKAGLLNYWTAEIITWISAKNLVCELLEITNHQVKKRNIPNYYKSLTDSALHTFDSFNWILVNRKVFRL